ncbi:hypothetical protein SUGI_0352230 [Cryptomeria japonica]|nr:hypothetical protein SUGI_0352230 [Cryptomeria japonica]
MVGMTKIILLIEADAHVPFMQDEHESNASPTVNNRLWSTVCGTFAGYWAKFKLLMELLKLEANVVSLGDGI